MSEIVLMKTGTEVLVPFDEGAADFIRKCKAGELLHSDFKRVRNYQFHKKYFALIKFAFDQWEPAGGLEAKSISFSQMDEIEFERLYSATIDIVLARILPRFSREDIDNVVENLLRFA